MEKKPSYPRSSWIGYPIVIVMLHVIGVAGLAYAASSSAAFWGLGLLAYTYGLRHAFDADHIAAIDNTVRKLTEQKRNPLGVGFYFSLGHSSVVFLLVLGIALSIKWIQNEMPLMQDIGGVIGMSVSGLFLILIGLLNLAILIQLLRMFRQMRVEKLDTEQLNHLLESRGLFARLFRPLFRFIGRSWHVYPLGFLFGLGFDTATEIGLLAVSATAAQASVPLAGILSLPILFAAGMSLMDTADGFLMSKAYDWAFMTPLRKMYYNITVTAISVAAALVIGVVELIQVAADKLNLQSPFFRWISDIDFSMMGYVLVGLFILAWIVSILVWKKMKLEQRFMNV
ncbi:HoxN/HupN/NixA family nickel/cobalt transporter [Paenibacillus beijingensis]|uniref:Nickel/cobalt efflux system n=1 Tax=Paenibacillus beijingensis TaxID=1126833 RepID=A0A0D5NNI7_9BACL|nr:HoxN/HupN/NixA family nickel/cobalt transporter [Paenibacillus beijingensis]AJY76705.1 hypothetical protein VN24_21700 [Paenibacillus beijingensis]